MLENEKYDLDYAMDSIIKIDNLKIESSIILIKQNKFEEATNKIFSSEQPNLIIHIKQIIKKFPVFDLVYLILKDLIFNFPNNIKKLYNPENISDIKNQYLPGPDKSIIKIEDILIDILTEIIYEYELILVQFYI